MIDLSCYFDLIGYRHEGKPGIAALKALQLRHTHTLPFENLNPLTGLPVRLDIPALLDKFTQGRGGYCYEHNLMFGHALASLGFATRPLVARVRLNVPQEVITPRTHMLVLVEAEGETWIADTGFGRATLTAPLRLAPGLAQSTPHGEYRVMDDPAGYRLEARLTGDWEPLYIFEMAPAYQPDFEMSNWYVSTNPASHFTRDLVAVRTTAGGRHVINNTRYSFYGLDGAPSTRQLESVDEIVGLLETEFGIVTAGVPGLRARLGGIVDKARAAG
ncbi:arylamine N-acetyltransferase [Massilia sp. ST3]|uniref:arylamine N-acetyltransferase family protein n=1 Tax=Massilia sp. ST3 TaxID=2824903 RepID=UPI001B82F2E0|nr:arylamine N-acetyltransferase [Massilia sp. ST3]MBQ5947511.1 arylamine N-acetyltransferase [Massilia sp. ST3]